MSKAAPVLTFAALLCATQPSPAQFIEQGPKLVLSAAGAAEQGQAVALSADGNTAILGGPADGASGAAWIWTRSAGVWTLQAKLVGTGAVGNAQQGYSVALSGDGNTAVVGGPFDIYNGSVGVGAVWVFTRSGGVWTQQGTKLVGVDLCSCHWDQGSSVALSGDGNTVIIGARFATFVFTRSEGLWTQQGPPLSFYADLNSVALSSDGNTAIVGDADMQGRGGVFVLTRAGSVWTQQAALAGTGGVGFPLQISVALSSDGNTAIFGNPGDNSNTGATWVFTRSGGVWTQQGNKLVGTGAVGSAQQGFSVALSGDGNTPSCATPAAMWGCG